MRIDRLDHLVLTVADIDATVRFYTEVLGMELVRFGAGRLALRFGDSKINLHEAGREVEPHALRPTPGSADLCLVLAGEPSEALAGARARLAEHRVAIELGPVERTGARGGIESLYVRDPDANLIELSVYPAAAPGAGAGMQPGANAGTDSGADAAGIP
ncbi:VOC family protein [Brevibacterium sp. 5221]|uniref:VOC family protein n=1 Tax=Brevibacterium rongguiense TaxID=2695267 RepID=A0A6N9H3V1_9MICO|nr:MULTISPECIES: VOC family protein [Brevibacterium]MYM18511.1 VOC family protein [Brevibacterium rongguiense]WAL39586.1 VOC family protein [Brevibacterium sp. BRM-1]